MFSYNYSKCPEHTMALSEEVQGFDVMPNPQQNHSMDASVLTSASPHGVGSCCRSTRMKARPNTCEQGGGNRLDSLVFGPTGCPAPTENHT